VTNHPSPAPSIDRQGLPRCTREGCPAYDGKRCELTGYRPESLCEPAVQEIVARIGSLSLTSGERRRLAAAAVGASDEVLDLIRIIERLTGKVVRAADEPNSDRHVDSAGRN